MKHGRLTVEGTAGRLEGMEERVRRGVARQTAGEVVLGAGKGVSVVGMGAA